MVIRLANIAVGLGIASILVSLFEGIWMAPTVPDSLSFGNFLIAAVATIFCLVSNSRKSSKVTSVGIAIGSIAVLLAIAAPNYIKD